MQLLEKGKIESVSHDGITWVDVQNPTRTEADILAREYHFHPLNLADCIAESHLSKIDPHDEYVFLLIHLPVYRSEKDQIASSQASVFLGKNYVVSLHDNQCKPLRDLFQRAKLDETFRQTYMAKSSAHLLYQILYRLVDETFPMLDTVMRKLDEVEDWVFDERVTVIREVSVLRRDIADLRRIIFPLRRLIGELQAKAQRYSVQDISAYFGDVKDHIEMAWENLEEAKETVEIYKDTDYILSSERANTILAVLTILFTLTIPPTVIGTLYGMNIPLPGGSETGPWTLPFGTYTTFIIMLLASLIPSSVMVWYFRRLGWFWRRS